jgi:hypothetical protein
MLSRIYYIIYVLKRYKLPIDIIRSIIYQIKKGEEYLIKKKHDELDFNFDKTELLTWNGPFSKMNLLTNIQNDDIDIENRMPTGFIVKSGLIDVNRFCWGIANYYGVLIHKDNDIIYFNKADKKILEKVFPRFIQADIDNTGKPIPILGDNTSYHSINLKK